LASVIFEESRAPSPFLLEEWPIVEEYVPPPDTVFTTLKLLYKIESRYVGTHFNAVEAQRGETVDEERFDLFTAFIVWWLAKMCLMCQFEYGVHVRLGTDLLVYSDEFTYEAVQEFNCRSDEVIRILISQIPIDRDTYEIVDRLSYEHGIESEYFGPVDRSVRSCRRLVKSNRFKQFKNFLVWWLARQYRLNQMSKSVKINESGILKFGHMFIWNAMLAFRQTTFTEVENDMHKYPVPYS
jgi:hypothetical protein